MTATDSRAEASDGAERRAPIALAVDIGGTKVESALVTAAASIVTGSRQRMPTGHGVSSADLQNAIRDVVSRTLAQRPEATDLVGVGIGCAGPISTTTGTVSPLNMPQCRSFPVVAIVEEASGMENVLLRLDGLCIALAEHWVGALQEFRNAMGMVVSTGIGGGILVDGRFLAGHSGNAGHVGQIRLHTRDGSGSDLSSTFEGVASGTNIVKWAIAQGWRGVSGEELAASYQSGDPIAIAAVRRCGVAIGEAVASVAALTDLEAVAIGGGFARVSPDLFDIARQTLLVAAPLDTMSNIRIVPTGLTDEGPLIGASGLIHRPDYVPSVI